MGLALAAQDVDLVHLLGVAEVDAQQESVELRLGQREGALVLDRVLRGDHHEGASQLVRSNVDGHVPLLHALEQARLGLRGGAVDLVHEHDVREDRARPELEAVLALVVDIGAHNVSGQHVRGALEARVLGVDRARDRPRQRRLAHPRVVLDQHVPLGEQRDDHIAQNAFRNLDRPRDVLTQA